MSIAQILQIAGSGMGAQRTRVQVIAANIAHSETTRTPGGGPYRRREAILAAEPGAFGETLAGVRVAEIRASQAPFPTRYEPGHPDADAQGLVPYPNVDPTEELVNLTQASRAFEANVAVIRAAKAMATSALDILRVS